MMKARDPRHPVLIRARMRAGGAPTDVRVRNISKNGMMLQAREVPETGSYVEVRLPDEVVVGRVMWAKDGRFGIRTRDRVPIWRFLGRPSQADEGAQPRAVLSAVPPGRKRDARMLARGGQFLFLACALAGAASMIGLLGYQVLSGFAEEVKTHL